MRSAIADDLSTHSSNSTHTTVSHNADTEAHNVDADAHNIEAHSTDIKGMRVNQLRELAVEKKQITEDKVKSMKKPELVQLLLDE